MSVSREIRVVDIQEWRLPGCDGRCYPRNHSPQAHEEYGYQKAQNEPRVSVVHTGPLRIDLDICRVTVHGEPVSVPPKEWDVLACLAKRPGQIVRRRDIAVAVWGEETAASPLYRNGRPRSRSTRGLHSTSVTVDRLRNRLGAAGYLIENLPLFGYRLVEEAAL